MTVAVSPFNPLPLFQALTRPESAPARFMGNAARANPCFQPNFACRSAVHALIKPVHDGGEIGGRIRPERAGL